MIKRTFALLCIVSLIAHAALADFRAGVAYRVVTPHPLLPVSGGVGPSNPVAEHKGDLTVRALVFESDDKTRVAIVGADFLGFPAVLGNQVRSFVKDIPKDNILIGVTHTHSAPDCYGFPNEKGELIYHRDYLKTVCEKMAEAINEAVANLQPCTLKIAEGEAKGKIAYNYYADQLYDPRCNVVQAIGADGKPFATLVNYAIHPEVLGSDRGILSPDLIGPLYDRIEERGGGVAIFMNGAQGGMVTADCRGADGEDVQTWDECIRIGNLLADEALRIVKDAPVQKSPKLFCAGPKSHLPGRFALNAANRKSAAPRRFSQPRRNGHHHRQPRQPGQRADADCPRRSPAQHRLLPKAQNERPMQFPLRPYKRCVRLHTNPG